MSSFELSEDKYLKVVKRIKILEEAFNNLAVAIDSLASIQQVQELLVIIQSDIKDMKEDLTALENRVTLIEEEPLS
jgi:hypothetical protein